MCIERSVRPDAQIRLLLAEREPSKIRWRLADFYQADIDAQLPFRWLAPDRPISA